MLINESAFDPVAVIRKAEHTVPMKMRIILIAVLLAGCSSNGTFDSDAWKDADLSTRNRVEMIDTLLSQHPLKGLLRSQVVGLLGEPTSTDKWEDWDMIYVLGPTAYMPIDNEWLVIKLDQTGHVSDYELTAD